MAKRTRSLRSMREQNDAAEASEREDDAEETTADDSSESETKVKKTRTRKAAGDKPVKDKAAAKPRVRTRKPKEPPRMVARWAVCDAALKRVAMFEYKDRAGADSKLAQMQELKKGTFVLQLVKEVYEPPVAAEPIIAV
jgi:hypothetical protein